MQEICQGKTVFRHDTDQQYAVRLVDEAEMFTGLADYFASIGVSNTSTGTSASWRNRFAFKRSTPMSPPPPST